MRHPLERVWLTFGDGPGPWTPRIQDALEAHGVRATFFMCGKRALVRPELVRDTARRGHSIGSHAFSHCHLRQLGIDALEEELRSSKEILEELSGEAVRLFLPPFCESDARVEQVASQLGMETTDCAQAIDPRDWEQPGAQELVRRVRHSVLTETWSRERLVLLHDGKADDLPTTMELIEDRSDTVAALPGMIEVFREHGVAIELL